MTLPSSLDPQDQRPWVLWAICLFYIWFALCGDDEDERTTTTVFIAWSVRLWRGEGRKSYMLAQVS